MTKLESLRELCEYNEDIDFYHSHQQLLQLKGLNRLKTLQLSGTLSPQCLSSLVNLPCLTHIILWRADIENLQLLRLYITI